MSMQVELTTEERDLLLMLIPEAMERAKSCLTNNPDDELLAIGSRLVTSTGGGLLPKLKGLRP